MDPERWRRLEEVFARAAELGLEARRALLDEICADDPELRRKVEAMLLQNDEAEGSLAAIVADAAERSEIRGGPGAEAPASAGRRIGAYRVLRELGHGGMGAVYLAERADDQYRQQVAIKLIRSGADNEETQRRFRAERQILATLDQANIARLMDGGTTDDGSPYVVMEYVEGRPIDLYCDDERLTIDQRLGLFRTVCTAVQYAHRNLVVHRDIKPANILVTAEGVTKLLDFGIAKLLDAAASPETPETRTAARLLTPEYASPEQVRGEPISTSSDVYSLGVLLYELLAGRRPYRLSAHRPGELERVICEQEPERPSTSAARDPDPAALAGGARRKGEAATAETISRSRRTQPDKLRRRLSGDLDNIVLTALRKEPERRYAYAEQLSEDLRRHLEGLPVLARPATLGYRARKFLFRHRWGVGTAAAALVLLALLVGFYTDRLRKERDRAQREQAKASLVSGFLTDLFEVSDPARARGETVTARELLDQGAARVDRELAGQPEVQATMMDVVGNVYLKLGLYDSAEPLLERALDARREVHGDNHAEVADSLSRLATLLRHRGDYEGAERLHREALEMRRKLFGPTNSDVAESLHKIALAREDLGDFEEAERLLRQAVELRRQLEDPQLSRSLNGLAVVLRQSGDLAAAEQLFQEALELQRARHGDDHPGTIDILNDLGNLRMNLDDVEGAEELYRRVIEARRRMLGDRHPELAKALANLSAALNRKRQFEESEQLQRESLAIFRSAYGDDHIFVTIMEGNLGDTLHARGDYDSAEPLYLSTLQSLRDKFGDSHPDVAHALDDLGGLYLSKGDFEASESHYERARAIFTETLGPTSLAAIRAGIQRASALRELGRYEEAEPFFLESIEMARQDAAHLRQNLHLALIGLGQLRMQQSDPAGAEPLLREGLDIRRANLPDHWLVPVAESLLGACLAEQGRRDEAVPLLRDSHGRLAAVLGDDDPRTRSARERLARVEEGGRQGVQ